MKNYLNQTIGFALMLMIMLISLQFVPEGIELGELPIRKMDIFSDIRSVHQTIEVTDIPIDTSYYAALDTSAWVQTDTITENTLGPVPLKDSIVYGKMIEDYTYDQSGLKHFFAQIDSIKTGSQVRIAWYGDSFVEGDILIGDLRDTLQSVWGGQGVGFVPVTSEVAQFKRTIKHQFKGWNTFSIIKKGGNRPALGINGYAYKPSIEASIFYEGAHYFKHTRLWTNAKLFYSSGANNRITWQLDDRVQHVDELKSKPGVIHQWMWEGNYPGTTSISMRFAYPDSLTLYGASLESGAGVYIDNFSVRGNSGGPLGLLKPEVIQQFDRYLKYDLIVLQVGLNAVTNSLNNIRWYEAELERTFKHLRKCFPNQPILIVSVGDRGGKLGDELGTMRGVPAIVSMQRSLARKHGFLFYDLFWGMGGPNSMIRLAMQRPRLANTDYTHLTHEGGKVIGFQFAGMLLEEQRRYKNQKQFQ
ncbi:MAG: hypothetical protein JNJ57_13175 [Saprospiraceae bacterium]|nr:hypothetical protein [Saprospiraceae bacterium]